MKILVTVRQVPDLDARVLLSDDGSEIETDGAEPKINYFDEVAVERAVRFKEAGEADELVAVCIGASEATKELRAALAMGVDRAILVEADEAELDPSAVSQILEAVVRREQPQMVLMGKLGVDFENTQVPQMLAARMGWPQATFAFSVEMQGEDRVVVGREVDGGSSYLDLPLPAIISADLRLNEPRLRNVLAVVKAKNKPLEQLEADDLDVEPKALLSTLRYELPDEREAGIVVASVEELIEKLRTEARLF
ncbi:MAG: electron transfer flavoprotein subunit beta/FixA family protein [Myxococcota bacterium]|jgi:electron transfer flavoprotein beta subunit|nr:electron transfer flavoprotein subunit beta/FixA family protein [Myxococcota bacterium]